MIKVGRREDWHRKENPVEENMTPNQAQTNTKTTLKEKQTMSWDDSLVVATETSGLLMHGDRSSISCRSSGDIDDRRSSMYEYMRRCSPTMSNVNAQNLRGSTRLLGNMLLKVDEDEQDDEDKDEEAYGVMPSASKNLRRSLAHNRRSTMRVLHESRFLRWLHSRYLFDAKSLSAGTIPQSIILSIFIACICGVCAFLYYSVLFSAFDFLWNYLPEQYWSRVVPEEYQVLWIPLVSGTLCLCVGLSVVILGEPGDLPYTISCIHNQAYIPMNHVIPMVVASLFSILAGGSLGPEAPLVAICGAMGGFCSRTLFQQTERNVIRKHTLMGMAGALAAFFGAPLGGSLFALEVNSRFGIEYFEHFVEATLCGELTLLVFRSLARLPISPIWDLGVEKLVEVQPWTVLVGGFLGLCGAATAYLFAIVHWAIMEAFANLGLLDNRYAVQRAILGGSIMILIGMIIPHTMFWGENEFNVLTTMGPAKDLPYVWPTHGLIGFELDSSWDCIIVGVAKALAISFTVAGGLRGGFIFPAFVVGGTLGRAFYEFLPVGSPVTLQVCVLSWAAGVNVGLTRTAVATTLILAFESGEPLVIPAVLMASICSLFATTHIRFIKTQITRSDVDHSLYHRETRLEAESAAALGNANREDEVESQKVTPVLHLP